VYIVSDTPTRADTAARTCTTGGAVGRACGGPPGRSLLASDLLEDHGCDRTEICSCGPQLSGSACVAHAGAGRSPGLSLARRSWRGGVGRQCFAPPQAALRRGDDRSWWNQVTVRSLLNMSSQFGMVG
jgi:hypothetical protein